MLARIAGLLLTVVVGILFFTGGRYSQLAGFFVYMSVACTLIPLPTPPYVIGMGRVFDPAIVGLVGATGNCLAAFVEYHFITWLFSKKDLQQKIEGNKVFQKFARFFKRAAFVCLLISGFTPIPFEPFRFAAILVHYPMPKYLLSVFIGRSLRYYFIAMIGDVYQIPNRHLIIMVIVLTIIPVVSHYINKGMTKPSSAKNIDT